MTRKIKTITSKSTWSFPSLDETPIDDTHAHVIVIGAGLGGLTAATLLAKRGYKVIVLESHKRSGGNCTSWKRYVPVGDTKHLFIFDSGVQDISGLGPKGPLTNLFKNLDADQQITWHRIIHGYWQNGLSITGSADTTAFIKNIVHAFPDEAANIEAFFAEVQNIYRELYADVDKTGGIPARPEKMEELLAWPEQHPHAYAWLGKSYQSLLDHYFNNQDLKQFLTTLSEYITDTTANLLVDDMVPLFGYYFDGGFYPSGGAQTLPNFLSQKLQDLAGTIHFRTRVSKILTENNNAIGVETSDGQKFFAPTIIANGDVVSALSELTPTNSTPDQYQTNIRNMGRGPSAVIVNLGLSTILPLPSRLFIKQNGLEFGIGNPCVADHSLAPEGHSALTILCLLSENDSKKWFVDKPSYIEMKRTFAERLIKSIEDSVAPTIRQHIIFTEVAAPPTFTRYTGALNGNIYGAARNEWRPQIKSPIKGLLLVGAGTETGAGIEAVVLCGTRAANMISTECPLKALTSA